MHGARERETPALLAEEPRTVITLSSFYGNNLQHNIVEYTFFGGGGIFRMKRGQFGGGIRGIWGAGSLHA